MDDCDGLGRDFDYDDEGTVDVHYDDDDGLEIGQQQNDSKWFLKKRRNLFVEKVQYVDPR